MVINLQAVFHKNNILTFESFLFAKCFSKSFEDILHFLRNPGIDTWDTSEIELILSQAYVWSTSFQGSENQVLNTAKETHNDDTFKKWTEKCHWPPRSSFTTTKPTMLGSMFGNRLSKSSHSH